MSIRSEGEYRALGIPNQNPFDWKADPVVVVTKRKHKKVVPEQVAARREAIKKQLLRENLFVDLNAYRLSNSERAGR